MISSRKLNKLGLVAGTALSASLLSMALIPQKAAAIMSITFIETGGNVELTLNGSLNVTGLSPNPVTWSGGGGGVVPNQGLVIIDLGAVDPDIDLYTGALTNPNNLVFGTGGIAFQTTASGSLFGLDPLNFLGTGSSVFFPAGYNGGIFNSTATYNSATFASLGLTPGTYTSGFNSGPNADSITINVQATPVTLESDAAPILGAVAFMGVGVWWKRRRAQAKADLNFDK